MKWKQIHESNEAPRVGSFYHMHLWKICFGFSIMSFRHWYVNCLGTELCLFKCSLQRAELDATSRIRYLGSTVSSFAHTESNEDWVSHFDQYVVYTIDMDIFDPSGLHILQYTTFMQSPVQASIAIYWSQISKQPWPFIIAITLPLLKIKNLILHCKIQNYPTMTIKNKVSIACTSITVNLNCNLTWS